MNKYEDEIEYLNDMKKYIIELKRIAQEDPEKAKELALKNLISAGIVDNLGNLCPPYNGNVVNESDFTRGPGIIKK